MAIGATAASLAAAGIGAAGAIGSSIASNKGNSNIAQQNNAFNEKMLQKQMDYNTETVSYTHLTLPTIYSV